MSKSFCAFSLFVGVSLVATGVGANTGGSAEAGQAKAASCMACHGADGNSPADIWPKIAGQVFEYTVKQLHDFREGRRTNDQMSPMAVSLSDQDIKDLAAHFATQQVTPGQARQDQVAQGEKIYLKGTGRAASMVTACVGCHGQGGEGNRDWSRVYDKPPTVLAPALGSQHSAYIANQLKAYKSGQRTNDVGRVMRNIASRMSEQDIEAVAEYISTLNR